MKKVGLFYGEGTAKTARIAKEIQKAFGDIKVDLIAVENAWAKDFTSYENIIIGTSTWFDGELPDYWDEMVPVLNDIDLKGKKVAIFGLGDQVDYPDNFADAIGILADIFISRGATLVGLTSTEGYTFSQSRAMYKNQFAGLVLDIENQSNKTTKRISDWVNALKKEFQ